MKRGFLFSLWIFYSFVLIFSLCQKFPVTVDGGQRCAEFMRDGQHDFPAGYHVTVQRIEHGSRNSRFRFFLFSEQS